MERYLKRFLIAGMMIALVAMLGFPPKAAWASPDSRQFFDPNCQGLVTEITSGTTPYEVLIVEDVLPWGYSPDFDANSCVGGNRSAIEEAVGLLGKSYRRITSATFQTMSSAQLSGYKIIIIPSDQTSTYYARINSNIGALTSAVQMGSVAIVHLVEGPHEGIIDGNKILPATTGAVNAGFQPYGGNTGGNLVAINSPTNCIVSGQIAADFSGWQYSTHGFFGAGGALPTGAEVIMSDITYNSTGYPCMIQYALGNGHVIASTQTVEYAFADTLSLPPIYRQLLLNEIRCAQLKLNPDEKLETKLDAIEAKLDNMGSTLISIVSSLTKIDTTTTDTQTKVTAIRTTVDATQTTVNSIEEKVDAIEAKSDKIETKIDDLCPFNNDTPEPTWPRWRQRQQSEDRQSRFPLRNN
jgi:hypothetical protein